MISRALPSVRKSELGRFIPPLTHLKCMSCGTENSRPFEESDFVFKQTGKCPKCGSTMLIHNIYVESRKLEKTK